MDREKELMLAEIAEQPGYLEQCLGGTLARDIAARLAAANLEQLEHVYLIGCGDSHFAGLATRLAFQRYAGVHVEPVQALEFSRYLVDSLPAHSAVIAVSNSGEVTRTVEGAKLARARGALVIAITAAPASSLAAAADAVILTRTPPNIKEGADKIVVTPGTLTYLGSLAVLYEIAFALGDRRGVDRGRMTTGRRELIRTAAILRETIPLIAPLVDQYAAQAKDTREFYILGGGPNYATALIAMAKLFEAVRCPASAVELEEWAHEQYFLTQPGTQSVVIAPPGASRDRAIEQMRAMRAVGGTVVAVAAADDTETAAVADVLLPVPGEVPEEFTPIIYKTWAELFACYLAHHRGVAFFGFDQLSRREINFQQIFASSSIAQ
ncbi:MAG TPA: SIS domain-containing protein [Chloroflexota bacterium]|nr:SIS domain-containing protein [Chloroflexota bacterium]